MTISIATTTPSAAPARPRISFTRRPWRELLRRIARRRPLAGDGGERTVPTGTPFDLAARRVEGFERGAAVWSYIGSAWQQAHVLSSAGRTALVSYQLSGGGDPFVEQTPAFHLVRRYDYPDRSSPATARDAAGEARATLLVHHADAHGMCQGCIDLAYYGWAPCPEARYAMRVLRQLPTAPVGAR